jgi:hypothetical protein
MYDAMRLSKRPAQRDPDPGKEDDQLLQVVPDQRPVVAREPARQPRRTLRGVRVERQVPRRPIGAGHGDPEQLAFVGPPRAGSPASPTSPPASHASSSTWSPAARDADRRADGAARVDSGLRHAARRA